jgi:hypothetical protein
MRKAVSKEEPKTPTLDRIREVGEQSRAIGEFLDWLRQDRKILLAEDKAASWTCHTCGDVPKNEVGFTGWMSDDSASWRHKPRHCQKVRDIIEKNHGSIPVDQFEGDVVDHVEEGLYTAADASPNKLLHAYFEIDEQEAEKERRALLDFVRNKQLPK